jgi:inner membrane transporter RhtA
VIEAVFPAGPHAGPGEPFQREAEADPVARVLSAVPPPGLVLLSIVSAQVGAALAIQLFSALGPTGTVFLRVGFSAVLLIAATRPAVRSLGRAGIGWIVPFGLVIGLMNLCFYEAIARIPLGIAVTIEFMGPLGVAVATSRRLADFLWVGLAGLGIVLLAPDIGGGLDPLGTGFAVLAGFGWAGYVLISRRVGKVAPGSAGLALAMAVAAIVLLPFAAAGGGLVRPEPTILAVGLGVAILSTTIPFSLEFAALKRMPPRAYGVLVTLEPAVAVLVGMALLTQEPGPRAILAVICVTVAATGVTLANGKR